jgi:hypothetical protein
MYDMFITLDVFHLDKLRLKPFKSANILDISCTLATSHLEISGLNVLFDSDDSRKISNEVAYFVVPKKIF